MGSWSIFGIGPLEAMFIVIMMLIILGPRDMVKTGRKLGIMLRKIRTSPTWKMISNTSNTLRKLPETLASETGIEDLQRELMKSADPLRDINSELRNIGTIDPRQAADGERPKDEDPPDGNSPPPEGESSLSAWTTPPKAEINNTPPPVVDNQSARSEDRSAEELTE